MQSVVLILVLVEHTLRGQSYLWRVDSSEVLILVLVEHTLREYQGRQALDQVMS